MEPEIDRRIGAATAVMRSSSVCRGEGRAEPSPWTPSSGGIPGMPHREETRGRRRTHRSDYVTRLAWERLGILPEELEEVSRWKSGCPCSDSCLRPDKQMKMDGWTDGQFFVVLSKPQRATDEGQ